MKQRIKTIIEEIGGILIAVALALLIRAFVYEPFKIPSTSMVPTLQIGDFLFVNKFALGTAIPHTDIVLNKSNPDRGDIVVFDRKLTDGDTSGFCFFFGGKDTALGRAIGCEYISFIKRVVAVPGDKISFGSNKVLYVNDEPALREEKGTYVYKDRAGNQYTVREIEEISQGVKRTTLIDDNRPMRDLRETVVPNDKFVVMGDNRDNSIDSRFWQYPDWGFVDRKQIVGRADVLFWSMDGWTPRFNRLFKSLKKETVTNE